ncbi:Alpha-ketoglutarate permease [Bdellovibrio bacteriovorus]|uniref:MFS transporter n=1 Tax=Bdellovibrio bacteriovorus TaxID=959 RepID=UPI00045C159E|nr:MFS transporter [Bdellovibrio bacteriovorus]AHZ84872.1 major facilitator transporter [Bdellovibrio bacteriovorus]BEV68758.1 Alpha-ketoglutarate permease [Bdellovibrio bacteriovorus]
MATAIVKDAGKAVLDKSKIWKVIGASSAGTLIEWYDFYIFGSLATIISAQFFPKGHETVALLSTLATFATGFIVRPFGALVFGRVGDVVGRKYAFMVTLLIMGLATTAIGLLPGYETIGIFAPILLLILRLLQGLALGGEYGGAATYVAEHSPDGKRGFYTSFIQTTATLGLFVSLGVILLTRLTMGEEAFKDWGWRIPFLLSVVLVLVSYLIRRRMEESPVFVQMKAEGKSSKSPLRDSFLHPENRRLVILALLGATAGQGVVWYTGQFYALYYLQTVLKVDFVVANQIIAVALLFATPFFIVFGGLSDRIGRKNIMMAGCLIAALTYYPIYRAMEFYSGWNPADPLATAMNPNVMMLTLLVFIQVLYVTMVYGPIAAFLVELFPTQIRYTSMSLPYHIGNGVFGGLVPFIGTAIVAATGNHFAGLIYPIGIALMTFVIGMIFIKEDRNVRWH